MRTPTLSWRTPEHSVPVRSEADLRSALSEAACDRNEGPVIVSLDVEGASLTHVVGDPTGSTLVFFPADYQETGVGSLHSVGDPVARDADAFEPVQVAYMNGHYTEFPRWMVVSVATAEQALIGFWSTGRLLPETVTWEPE